MGPRLHHGRACLEFGGGSSEPLRVSSLVFIGFTYVRTERTYIPQRPRPTYKRSEMEEHLLEDAHCPPWPTPALAALGRQEGSGERRAPKPKPKPAFKRGALVLAQQQEGHASKDKVWRKEMEPGRRWMARECPAGWQRSSPSPATTRQPYDHFVDPDDEHEDCTSGLIGGTRSEEMVEDFSPNWMKESLKEIRPVVDSSKLGSTRSSSWWRKRRKYKWHTKGNTINILDDRGLARVSNFPKSRSDGTLLDRIMSSRPTEPDLPEVGKPSDPMEQPQESPQFILDNETIPLIDFRHVSSALALPQTVAVAAAANSSSSTTTTTTTVVMGPLLEHVNVYNRMQSEREFSGNASVMQLRTHQDASSSTHALFKLGQSLDESSSSRSGYGAVTTSRNNNHQLDIKSMRRTFSQGENGGHTKDDSTQARPMGVDLELGLKLRLYDNDSSHLEGHSDLMEVPLLSSLLQSSHSSSSKPTSARRVPLVRQQGTLQFDDEDPSESKPMAFCSPEHVPLVHDVSSPSQDDGFFSQTGGEKTDSPEDVEVDEEDAEECKNHLSALNLVRRSNLNGLPLKRALTLPSSDMTQLRSPMRRGPPGTGDSPDEDMSIDIPYSASNRPPILRAESMDTSLVIPTFTVTINPLEDDEITFVPDSPTTCPPSKTLSESIDSNNLNETGKRNGSIDNHNLTCEELDDRRCSIGSASSLQLDNRLGVPDLTIRRVSEISHINELRQGISGMEHINSECYEVVRDVNPDTFSLDSIHQTVFKRCQNKYVPPQRSSTQNKCFVIVTSGCTIFGIIYGFWYKNFGPGAHDLH
ncbi:hypothetical protein TCAL_17080 [Tigriopus californicus]|uniref:Uncharacterized protein n=1 Tax=Tigriopus californicus TaxID=6832 RepID=A0A553PP91_TIGCA|nr:hypothetical protein TCAL_17080 [Tigriopus californicus]